MLYNQSAHYQKSGLPFDHAKGHHGSVFAWDSHVLSHSIDDTPDRQQHPSEMCNRGGEHLFLHLFRSQRHQDLAALKSQSGCQNFHGLLL